VSAGLEVLSDALVEADRIKEPWWTSELHRLSGEMRLQLGDQNGVAEHCFQRALDVAGAQGARPLELRSAMSMARLWQQQGKTEESHAILQQVYGLFSEGLDTPDLLEARTLLESLST
jgi:predicted ATPase